MTLQKEFELIFRFIGGSHLYGTNTKYSDIDTRGVFIPTYEYFLGFLHNVRQVTEEGEDTEYHELRQFLKLALDNNPNIIEYLFVPKNKWLVHTPTWEKIVAQRDKFVSKKCKFTFSGYAFSQFNRIKRHRGWLINPPSHRPERKEFGLLEDRSALSKDQIGAFNMIVTMYLEEVRSHHKLKGQLLEMEETHNFKTIVQNAKNIDYNALKTLVPISDNFIEALEKEKNYMNARKEWNSYQSWKQGRNPVRKELERKFGYDTKFCMHCFRLISEGKELLETGHITFPRPDAEYLLEIRNGLYTYDELYVELNKTEEIFNTLYNISTIQKTPQKTEIDKLCCELVGERFGWMTTIF